jgi:hypothetical protein
MSNVFQNVDKMWFGTKEHMQWIDTPLTGANVSTSGNVANVDLINGGAHVRNSFDSNKNYNFTWGSSVDRRMSSIIRAYRNGSYGRGLIYFIDPMYYETNILPQRWADPSMSLNYEAPGIAGQSHQPSITYTQNNNNGLPVNSVSYTFKPNESYDGLKSGDSIWIPVPPGAELIIWAHYSSIGGASIKVREGGVADQTYDLIETPADETSPTPLVIDGGDDGSYAEMYISTNKATVQSVITVSAMTARIRWPGLGEITEPYWYTGEGHSGCKFVGSPTVYNNSGIGGGQVSLSCELKEVGSWV